MLKTIKAENPSQAWLKASQAIVEEGKMVNNLLEIPFLIVEIKSPQEIDSTIDRIFRRVKTKGSWWIDHTAGLLMPQVTQETLGPQALGKSPTSQTYWQRLTGFGGGVDQLRYVVKSLKRKPRSTQLFCTPFDPQIDIQPMLENPKRPYMPRMPCLVGLGFLNREKGLNLVATFRSHDFGRKAYGNYVGLGKLLGWVCQETSLKAGRVFCFSHSAHIRRKELKEIKRIISVLQKR